MTRSGFGARASGAGLRLVEGSQRPLQIALLENRGLLLRFLAARGVPDPEDVYQELWARLVNDHSISHDPLSYVMKSAHNLVIDRIRSSRQRLLREKAFHELSDVTDGLAGEASRSDRILIARQEVERARSAISELGERNSKIFYRFRVDGLSRPEIAREFAISVSAVEKHLSRAYRRLTELADAPDVSSPDRGSVIMAATTEQ